MHFTTDSIHISLFVCLVYYTIIFLFFFWLLLPMQFRPSRDFEVSQFGLVLTLAIMLIISLDDKVQTPTLYAETK